MREIEEYKEHLRHCIDAIDSEGIDACADLLKQAWTSGNTVYVIGNGGSASTASHVACDLNKGSQVEGVRAMRVIGLADNMAHFSALANDLSFEDVFVEQLKCFMNSGDVVIGISASGNSPNCVKAFEYAKDKGGKTVGWLGFSGGKMKELSDASIHVPCNEYGPVEDAHLIINHIVTVVMKGWLENQKSWD